MADISKLYAGGEEYSIKDETAREAIRQLQNSGGSGGGLTAAQISALDGMFKVASYKEDPSAAYAAFVAAFGIEREAIPATGITLSVRTLSFVSAESCTIVVTVEPADSTDSVVWTSSNQSVATVENGMVIPVADGSCIITATAGSVSAECAVTVAFEAEVVRYSVTNVLTSCFNSNPSESVNEGTGYTAALTAEDGYVLDTVTVTMGDADVTADTYADGSVSIPAVTGDVVITATAIEEVTLSFTPGEPYEITWTDGVTVSTSTGDTSESSSLSVSDYLPVGGASALLLSGTYTNYGIFYYTGDKTFLARLSINESWPATVLRDAAYVRVQCRTTGKASCTVTPVVYDALGATTAWESGTYYILPDYTGSAGLNETTGAEKSDGSWWISGYSFCYGAKTLNITGYQSVRMTVVFYDADKNYISGSKGNSTSSMEVPETAMYFRVSSEMITSTDARYKTDNPWVVLT